MADPIAAMSLMKTAPELLSCLKEAMAFIAVQEDEDRPARHFGRWSRAYTAIREAEGK